MNSPAPEDDVAALSTLPKRRDFLAAARARKSAQPGLILQARARAGDEHSETEIRFGLTCSRKVGNAVVRNRARRRLRAAAMAVLPGHGKPGWDYVLIGRREATVDRPFPDLLADVTRALTHVHRTGEER
ncbi:MAG: ribonuclease P protein component [Rubricella sp.]